MQLYEAGSRKLCPDCTASVSIPDTTRLRELSGDRYPLLPAIDKVRLTAQVAQPPFDGHCHSCHASAEFSTPCMLQIMVERHVEDDGGIRPTLTGGVQLVVSASEEVWETTIFPLLLCGPCQRQFKTDRRWLRVRSAIKQLTLFGLLIGFCLLSYFVMELVAALSGILFVIAALTMWARGHDSKKISSTMSKWLRKIHYVREVIDTEDEFHARIGQSAPLVSTASK